MAAEYELVDTAEGFSRAASVLARGRGPFAIDTERASSFRYDDRAFLVQIYRRDAGTFLFAPEGLRDEFSAAVGPVVTRQSWILHAASEDLPSLGWLRLFPGELFDTELAGRLAGFSRPNLAAMVQEFCGVELAKGHGREDWSRRPLPEGWLEYAALDVAYLNLLAEAQAELLDAQGKLEWLEAECEHLVSTHADDSIPTPRSWRDTKGIGKLRTARSLHIARTIWEHRERQARETDTAPGALLPNRALVELAQTAPTARRDAVRTRGVRRVFDPWPALVDAYHASPASYPDPRSYTGETPGKTLWQREAPTSYAHLQAIRQNIAERADKITIHASDMLAPALLRAVVWEATTESGVWSTHRIAVALQRRGARMWQIALTAPLIAAQLNSD